MTSVTFYDATSGQTQVAEVLTWDGQQYHLEPPDPEKLNSILGKRARDMKTGQVVTANEPELWMPLLRTVYRSAYYWADAAVEGQPA